MVVRHDLRVIVDDYVFAVEGLDEAIANAQALPEEIIRAARLSVDRTAERARTAASRAIRSQVNFTAQYLTGQGGRLEITDKATNSNIERIITGRHRATSLANFVTGQRKAGLVVTVKPGRPKFMKGTFLFKLRRGAQLTDTVFNQGLAIRLKRGDTLRNKHDAVQISKGLYLLYGPSVDQVFRQVSQDISGDASDFMEDEFYRLLGVL